MVCMVCDRDLRNLLETDVRYKATNSDRDRESWFRDFQERKEKEEKEARYVKVHIFLFVVLILIFAVHVLLFTVV